jgi:hypothetical protein
MSRKSEVERVFVEDREQFLSIWAIAHEWESLSPPATNGDEISVEVRRWIDKVLLGFFRGELTLRKSDGYRVLGQRWWERLFGLDKQYEKLWNCLTRAAIDMQFLDGLYVMRSEILHWCPKEFIEPPACWAPLAVKLPIGSEEEAGDHDGWYDALTDRRRRIVACLELAKHLWKHDQTMSYEDVRGHSLLSQTGFGNVFSAESFKTWARPFAPDDVKRGGRRRQSDT